jgi:hypothetical protein
MGGTQAAAMADIVIRVLDSGLGPRLFDQEPTDLVVTPQMTMPQVISAILAKLGGNRMSRLAIFAHGYVRYHDQQLQMSNLGGLGVQLGKDDLGFGSVDHFAALKGRFAPGGQIDMFACQIADTASADGPARSGAALMSRLAAAAGVPVRASDSVHNYRRNAYLGTIDRGDWEGNVFLFKPDGSTTPELVSR